jgi:hypothetical protein
VADLEQEKSGDEVKDMDTSTVTTTPSPLKRKRNSLSSPRATAEDSSDDEDERRYVYNRLSLRKLHDNDTILITANI